MRFAIHAADPIAVATVEVSAMSARPYRQNRSETILVVDDEVFVRDYCSSVLTHAGYEVLLAETGHQALELVKTTQKPIHLALIDIRMPKMSGPELLVELLDLLVPRNLQIRFILMSGYADTRGDPAYSAKRYSFMQKPFNASDLLATVRHELDRVERMARGKGHPCHSGVGS